MKIWNIKKRNSLIYVTHYRYLGCSSLLIKTFGWQNRYLLKHVNDWDMNAKENIMKNQGIDTFLLI